MYQKLLQVSVLASCIIGLAQSQAIGDPINKQPIYPPPPAQWNQAKWTKLSTPPNAPFGLSVVTPYLGQVTYKGIRWQMRVNYVGQKKHGSALSVLMPGQITNRTICASSPLASRLHVTYAPPSKDEETLKEQNLKMPPTQKGS